MSFHELPTELLLTIGEFCKPCDAYNLALCSRELHVTLRDILSKHLKVWRYWNTVDTKHFRRPFYHKLLKLTRKPHLAYYVETFRCEFEYDQPDSYSIRELHELIQHLKTLPITHRRTFDDFKDELWHQSYQNGLANLEMRTLASYLIYVVPNLRRLECYGSTIGDDDLLRLLVNLAQAPSDIAGLPLQHLKVIEVKLDRNITEGGLPMDWLLASMYLPCVESFAASRMNSCVDYLSTVDIPKSNLKNLTLQASTFEADKLIFVLSKMITLKSFAYENGQDSLVFEGGSFSPKRITAALLLYASHSLKHLTVHGEDYDVPMAVSGGVEWPYVSLVGFKQLKTLRCSTSLLTSDPELLRPSEHLISATDIECYASDEYKKAAESYKNDDFLQPTPGTLRRLAFGTRLPQSLTALHLEDYPCHTPLAYSALAEFVQKAGGLLPRLKQLYLSDWGVESLQHRGFLEIVAQKGLKYKKLPDPFWIGITVRDNNDSDSSEEEANE